MECDEEAVPEAQSVRHKGNTLGIMNSGIAAVARVGAARSERAVVVRDGRPFALVLRLLTVE